MVKAKTKDFFNPYQIPVIALDEPLYWIIKQP